MFVRKVCSADAESLAEIYNYYITETTASFELQPVSVEEMRRRITTISEAFPYYVCCEGKQVLGYCYAHIWKERPAYNLTFETTVYVSRTSCGNGIGRLLMTRLISDCRTRGVHSLIACITAENRVSIRFHKSLGFNCVSCFHEVGFKFNRWLDVIDCELLL